MEVLQSKEFDDAMDAASSKECQQHIDSVAKAVEDFDRMKDAILEKRKSLKPRGVKRKAVQSWQPE
eukprot:1260561-Alexandrium_andersonii.AAC.1